MANNTTCGTQSMGLGFGLNDYSLAFKRQNRWLLMISGISAQNQGAAVQALPPLKSSRPSLSFKEIEAQHLSESVWFPMKPEWKQLNLVLYDLRCNENVVFEWIKMIYNPQVTNNRIWNPSVGGASTRLNTPFKKQGQLVLYDGCGKNIENWVLENCYPSQINFGSLDMSSSEVVTMELELRFDRAYLLQS